MPNVVFLLKGMRIQHNSWGFLSPCQAQNPHEIPSQLQDHTAIMSSEQGLLKARVPEKKQHDVNKSRFFSKKWVTRTLPVMSR